METLIYFYPIIIGLGIVSSYTDIKFKKIKNNHLLIASIAGVIVYLYLLSIAQLKLDIYLLLNPLLALGIGFLFYYCNVWGAGDAKLFAVFCLLLPTKRYSDLFPFPSLAVFANIFLLSTVVILTTSLIQIIKNIKAVSIKAFLLTSLLELIKTFLIILSLSWVISPLLKPLSPYLTPFLYVVILYFSYSFVYTIVDKIKNNFLVFLIFILGFIFHYFYQPADLTLALFLKHAQRMFSYSLIFYSLRTIFELNKKTPTQENIIPFAPLMLIGTLLAATNSLFWIIQTLKLLRK